MHTFTEEQTPAHIVKVFPKASDVFKTYGINFCCQGERQLKDTFNEKELEGLTVLTHLNDAYSDWQAQGNQAVNWEELSVTEIAQYIKENYYHFLEEELPALETFVTRINHVHGYTSPHLQELMTLYYAFLTEAEQAMIQAMTDVYINVDQDNNFLPTTRTSLENIRGYHENMMNLFQKMRNVTNEFTPPLDACGSYRVTYARLKDLEKMMMEYIHLENNILFARVDAKI